ncbi:DUF4167 domain-containing protein [Paracoccus benzoatiresistens]|uniref:DUF4167 domain-containing protein n=1 Tax=Paracoccus benzoatiresistens TaxID=2997341 RepID=A0ABT4IZ02_9RHOB|nr:DUF4167 domain-containing protein [Paracoccus sp. EF6]MCZ0960091.1 DUF4167 domain-containing protein [Paracoccus sp. EF6]
MRSSKSRSRNKSNRQRTLGNIVNRVFDSSGPEGKVRGTPQQIIDKYLTLARDAQLSGDRVAEQAFLQHAEHYTRMLGEAQREMAERQQFHQSRQDGEEGREGQPNGNNGHQYREAGGRDQGGRDDSRRDNGPRENGGRENGGRDNGQRDNGYRDNRDQQRDQGARDQGSREQPRSAPVAEQREDDRPARQPEPAPAPQPELQLQPEGLPDAVTTSEEEAAGPVETPESGAKPARSRAPRAPRAEKPATPRAPRRRKAPEDQAKAEETPAASEE